MVKINNLIIYILYLLPISIISGPFLSDLSIVIIDLWILFKIFNEKGIISKYFNNKILLFFLLFNICLIFSSAISDHLVFSLKSSFLYFRFYLFSFAIWYIFENLNFSFKYFFFSVSIAIILIIISAIFDLIYVKEFFNNIDLSSGELRRVSGLFGDELIMGSILKNLFVFFIILFCFLNYFEKKYINTLAIIFILWTISFAVLISGERTSIFIYLIYCVFAGIILRKKFSIIKVSIISILTVTILFLTFDHLRERVLGHTLVQLTNKERIFDNFGNEIKRDLEVPVYLSIHHDAHARTAIKMFLSKPIFGYGPNNFRKNCHDHKYNQFSCTTHPHNTYLQLLSETGIVGITFFIIALAFIIFELVRKKNLINLEFRLCLIYFLIYFLPFMPSGNFFNNYVNINFYLLVGMCLYFKNLHNKNSL